MIFPEEKRRFYEKNPLDNVIVQFRFSPILNIVAKTPSGFQDAIIKMCPEFEEKPIVQQQFNFGGGKDLMPSLLIQSPVVQKVYVFSNSSEGKAIELAFNSLTVTFSKYRRWEEFREAFTLARTALEDIYGVSLYTRIGLRYIDRFTPSKLNLNEKIEWRKMINPAFMGLGGIDEEQTINSQCINEAPLGQYNAKALISVASLKNTVENKMDGVVLDYDCSIEGNTAKADLHSRLEYLHVQSRNIFEYAVRPDLRTAMGEIKNDTVDK